MECCEIGTIKQENDSELMIMDMLTASSPLIGDYIAYIPYTSS